MSSSANYNEWTRQQKDEFAKQRMLLMKSKNAKLMQRHAEVEQDRIKAEECNSSITTITKVIAKKEKPDCVLELNEIKEKTQYVREWDRGKSDKECWKSPDYHPSYSNRKSSHFEKKVTQRRGDFNDNVHNYSRTDNKLGDRSRRENYHKNASSSYHHMGPKTGREEYQNNERCWTSHKTYPEEIYDKGDYKRSNSRRNSNKTWSPSCNSGSGSTNFSNLQKLEKSIWWSNNKYTDDKSKQAIVEHWVTSVNRSNNLNQPEAAKKNKEEINITKKPYSKFDRFERSPNHSDDDEDDDLLPNSLKLIHGGKIKVSDNQVFHENDENKRNESIQECSSDTNERGYVKKPDKYSYEVHSSRCNKNESVRKQKRFEKNEIKNDFKERFTGNKEPKSIADVSGGNSVLPKYYKLGCRNDSNYHKRAACNVDDDDGGLWGSTEQPDIKWKLSDDESKNHESIKKLVSPKAGLSKKGCSEMCFPQRSKMAKPDDEKNSDGDWSTVSEEGELPNSD